MTHTTYITPAAPTPGVRNAFEEAAYRRTHPVIDPVPKTKHQRRMERLRAEGPVVMNINGHPISMVVSAFCGGVDSKRMARAQITLHKERLGRKVLRNV